MCPCLLPPCVQGWLAELAPWASLLLPGGPTQAAQLQARWAACLAACGCAPCAPPELPCEAVGHAVQHVRGQQQLQVGDKDLVCFILLQLESEDRAALILT